MLLEYFTVLSLADLKLIGFSNINRINRKAQTEDWTFQVVRREHSDKPIKEYHISNFPRVTREQIVSRLLEKVRKTDEAKGLSVETTTVIHNTTYARLEIVLFVIRTDYPRIEFCDKYNNKQFTNNDLSDYVYIYVPKLSKTRLYELVSDYQKSGIEGIKYKRPENNLGTKVLDVQ